MLSLVSYAGIGFGVYYILHRFDVMNFEDINKAALSFFWPFTLLLAPFEAIAKIGDYIQSQAEKDKEKLNNGPK